jgi:UPF0755 protein
MKILRGLVYLALLVTLTAGLCLYRLTSRYEGFERETFVEIPRGASTMAIASQLAAAGVIRSRLDFLLAYATARRHVLQAGEYRFAYPESPRQVFDRIARGDVFYYTLTVPEGQNMFDISRSAAALGLFTADDFLAAARNPGFIHDLDPHAPTLEGYLFPGVYKLTRHATPQSVCRLMTAKFREVWRGLRANANPHDAVILASLVEREAKLPQERPIIAAVFTNRLRLGMKLDCDPTTIYAALLDHHYRGTIYRSDLDSDNPYNTYRHAGLPPGPICNPGLDSIRAALLPADSDALYFVAKPDGSGAHEFSSTLGAHNLATQRYRRSQQ